jgi:hypothetical protein
MPAGFRPTEKGHRILLSMASTEHCPAGKPTDNRSFEGDTCQAEAIPPDELARIVREAIAARVDDLAYEAVLDSRA